jgi:hypothetical protein
LKAFIFYFGGWRFLFLFFGKLNVFVFSLESWRFLFLFFEMLKAITLIKVEGFYFCFRISKVLAHTFKCWRVLLLLFDVKGYYFYSWMFKICTFSFRCWNFLFLLLDMKGSYFCSWMLKVFVFECTSKLCTQGKTFSKVLKIIIQFTWS